MSLVECRTAEDVRALAKQRADWRRKQYAQVKQELAKPPTSVQETRQHWATKRSITATLCVSYGCLVIKRTWRSVIPLHLQNRIKEIQEVVAKELGVSVDCMVSNRRRGPEVRARQLAMWFCRSRTVQSLPEIGKRFGGRDHTTILHAIRMVEERRHSDPELAERIDRITAALG
jgi:hypothetical protein